LLWKKEGKGGNASGRASALRIARKRGPGGAADTVEGRLTDVSELFDKGTEIR